MDRTVWGRLSTALSREQMMNELSSCNTIECFLRLMDNTTMRNCTYRYSSSDSITSIALWIDGPCTCIAALLSLIGAYFAVRFLKRAGLNKDLTAALFSLCLIDVLLMITVVLFYCIEAIGVLLTGTNIMYKHQAFTSSLHGVASSMTTSSTMLVIYITFLRFMVVMRPLRYARQYSSRGLKQGFQSGKHRKSCSTAQEELAPPMITIRSYSRISTKHPIEIKKFLKPYLLPGLVILFSFAVNIPVYFEFTVDKCFDVEQNEEASCPAPTVFRSSFTRYKAVLMTLTQTVGPVATILILTLMTEYRVHISLKARRKLFESQQRSRSVVLSEELKERVSRTVAIFIAIKFLIFRSMPVFFDVYENLYGIESFGVFLSVLVRVSDFMIVLNSATNSLAYFGKKRWLEKRLRFRLLKKEQKRIQKAEGSDRRSSSQSERKSTVIAMNGAFRQITNGNEFNGQLLDKESSNYV